MSNFNTVLTSSYTHEVVSERFHNSQNENDMNYKNFHRMKCLVFPFRLGSCWFSLNCVNKIGAFRMKKIQNENARKEHQVHVALIPVNSIKPERITQHKRSYVLDESNMADNECRTVKSYVDFACAVRDLTMWPIFAGPLKVNRACGLGLTYTMSSKLASKMSAKLSF